MDRAEVRGERSTMVTACCCGRACTSSGGGGARTLTAREECVLCPLLEMGPVWVGRLGTTGSSSRAGRRFTRHIVRVFVGATAELAVNSAAVVTIHAEEAVDFRNGKRYCPVMRRR